jgi:hypothetical protein
VAKAEKIGQSKHGTGGQKMATEKRLIYVDKPIKETESIIHFRMCHHMPTEDYESFLNYLKKQPTVDAVEAVHGRWLNAPTVAFTEECSACGFCVPWDVDGRLHKYNYCPNCGASMKDGGNCETD